MSAPMRVIVAGTRTFNDYALLCRELDFRRTRVAELVSGACPEGADALGERWAKERGVPVKLFPADWKAHGKKAGFLRNREMALYANAALLFWDGVSRGTKLMLNLALEHLPPLRVTVVRYDQEAGVSP